MTGIEAYPLCWPDGWKRTPRNGRRWLHGRLQANNKVHGELLEELRMLGASGVIVSSNLPVRRDGIVYSSTKEPDDPGVAVYFQYKKKPMCFACDNYTNVSDNLRAVRLTINAIRGLERWGASDMMERAFRGFAALPEKASSPWREVLEFNPDETVTREMVKQAFNSLAFKYHPDHGGTDEQIRQLLAAREQAEREITA